VVPLWNPAQHLQVVPDNLEEVQSCQKKVEGKTKTKEKEQFSLPSTK
jgi:hypothetical protein